jgi:tetratricopeptide (TPR) repeat protein
MSASKKVRDQLIGCLLVCSGVLTMLACTLTLAGQSARPSSQATAAAPPALPDACLRQRESSEKIAVMLGTVHDHPTAGAYNTLGVLFAQADRVSCAIAAFEGALKLDSRNWEIHYDLALALITKGDRVRAERELQTAIQQKPYSVSAHFALGSLLEDEKRLVEAEGQFRSTLKIDPSFAPGAIKLNGVLIAEGKPQAAVACLESATKQSLPPDQAESLLSALGMDYAGNGEMEKASKTLEDLVAAQPDSGHAHFSLGLLYARRGQPGDGEAAATELRKALRLDHGIDAARIALGQVLTSLHQYSDAIADLRDYTGRQPKDAQGFYALGQAYRGLEQSDAAIGAFQHAVALDPRDPAIRFNLGTLLAATGQIDAAIRQLEAAERIAPSDLAIHDALASLQAKAGDKEHARLEQAKVNAIKSSADRETAIAKFYGEAAEYLSAGNAKAAAESYRKALQLNARDAKLHYNLSLALDRLGELSEEQKELERTVDLDPTIAVAQNQLGLFAFRAGQQAAAEKLFKKALAIDPTFSEAQTNLGALFSQQGKTEEAAQLFQQAIENDPKDFKAYVDLGLVMAQKGAFSEAEQQFHTAIQLAPGYADAYGALGMLQAKAGRGVDAVDNFQKAAKLAPDSAQAHLNLGIALVEQFDRPGGLREFSEAVRLDPKLASTHYNLGRFFFETGKYDEADKELQTAIRLQPDYASALYFLALTAKQEEQPGRTTALLEKAVALQPGNADAQYLLGQALEHSGDSTGAVQHWKLAVQASPKSCHALYDLSRSLKKSHDPEAAQYQDRLDALEKEQQIGDRASELAAFAQEAADAHNWPQAVEQMNEAIQLCGTCPQSANLHKNFGFIYGRVGNIAEAKKELLAALQLTPHDVDAQTALTALERAHDEKLK